VASTPRNRQASGAQATTEGADNAVFLAVRKVIDQDIRPFVQADGGDIELLGVENNKVRVRLLGACEKCPSSLQTLRMGVQARLQAKVSPELVVDETAS
jgi:NifU-like protein